MAQLQQEVKSIHKLKKDAETQREALNAEHVKERAALALQEWEIVKSLGENPHNYEIDYEASKRFYYEEYDE